MERNTSNVTDAKKKVKRLDSRVNITIKSYRRFDHDTDGISVKAALDGIVKCGILSNDSAKEIKSIKFESEFAEEEKTIIEIEDEKMSYARWSTPIENGLSIEQYSALYATGGRKAVEREHHKRHTVFSHWYIFWDDFSGDLLDDQYLAIWNNKAEKHPNFSYWELKNAFDSDDYSIIADRIGCKITQKQHLRDCIKLWLLEVEEQFSGY